MTVELIYRSIKKTILNQICSLRNGFIFHVGLVVCFRTEELLDC